MAKHQASFCWTLSQKFFPVIFTPHSLRHQVRLLVLQHPMPGKSISNLRSLGFLAGAQSLKIPDTFSPSGPILLPLKDICRSFCCLATSANTWQVHFAWHSTTNRSTTQLQLPWPLHCLSKSIQSQWTSGRAWAAAVLLPPVTSKAESSVGAFGIWERRGAMRPCESFASFCLSLQGLDAQVRHGVAVQVQFFDFVVCSL